MLACALGPCLDRCPFRRHCARGVRVLIGWLLHATFNHDDCARMKLQLVIPPPRRELHPEADEGLPFTAAHGRIRQPVGDGQFEVAHPSVNIQRQEGSTAAEWNDIDAGKVPECRAASSRECAHSTVAVTMESSQPS